jgi:hypothetical protein
MIIDAFAPEGVTQIAKDSIFMLPHLGALAQLLERAAREVLENDCVVPLATCVAPVGPGRPGRACLDFCLERGDGTSERGAVPFGELRVIPLAPSAEAELIVEPRRGFDAGEGRSRAVKRRVRGGDVGVVFDCRGRPFAPPSDEDEALSAQARWLGAIGALGKEG